MITLIIWRLLKFKEDKKEQNNNLKKINKKEKEDKEVNKNRKKIIIISIVSIFISVILGLIFNKFDYIKDIYNKTGVNYLTNYVYDIFVVDKTYLHTFISVFPVSLIIGIYYIFKEDNKHFKFFCLSVIVSVFQLIILLSNIKIEVLPNYIFALGFNLLQIYMLVYIFSNLEEKFFNLIKSAYIALILLVFFMFMPIPKEINSMLIELFYMIFVLETYIVLNYSDKRFWRLASWIFTLICVLQSIAFLIVKFV